MTDRIKIIDIAKGLSITLVVFSHSQLAMFFPDLNHALGLFRVPFFFFITGVFFNELGDFKSTVLNKVDALYKPYLVTLSIFLLLQLVGDNINAYNEFVGILYGVGSTITVVPLWFLPHIFILYLILWPLTRVTNIITSPVFIKFIFVAVLCGVGSISMEYFRHNTYAFWGANNTIAGLPFSLDLVLVSASFFITGWFLKNYVKLFKPTLTVLLATLFIFAYIAVFTEANVDLNMRIYEQPLYATIAAYCGIYLLLCVAYLINSTVILQRVFCRLGMASLFVLIFHFPVENKIYMLLTNMPFLSSIHLPLAIVSFILCLIVSLALQKLVSKNAILALLYLPVKSKKPAIESIQMRYS